MNIPAAELTVLQVQGFACIRIVGRATFACSPAFQEAAERLLAGHPARMVLDLGQCQVMDSTFLGVLAGEAASFRQALGDDRKIELHNANDRVTGLISSLGVSSLFSHEQGHLAVPAGVHTRRLSAPDPTKIQLKETSLAAHERLMQVNEANRQKFSELTRFLKDDLDRLKAGEPPSMPGFDIAARIEQVGEVSGDFYEFAPRGGLRAGVLIADVSGKGTAAAQIAARARPVLRAHLATERPPAVVFREVLPRLVPELPEDVFITSICIVLDSVSRSFRMARAGHDPLLWYHASTGEVELLSPKGMAVGIERTGLLDATFVEREHDLHAGDVLLLHTDGITESLNPEQEEFGCARLVEALKAAAPLDARALVAKIFTTVHQFTKTAPQLDDRTLVVIKAT